MLNNNPFSILAETVSPLAMQYFIIANGIIDCCWNNYSNDTSQKSNLFF